jgi:capsule polysaccharide export protein KpsE/RkpR
MANDLIRFTNNLLWDLNRRETESITSFVSRRYTELQTQQSDLSRRLEDLMKRTNIYDPESQLPATSQALIEARVNESTQRATLAMLEQVVGADDPKVVQQRALLQESVAERKRLEQGGSGVGPSVTGMPSALMEYARLRQDYEVNAQLLALIEPMYEQTRFDEERDIPQLIMLREALPPPVKARPRKGLAIVSAFVGTLILGYLVIALVAFLRSFARRYEVYREVVESRSSVEDRLIGEGGSLNESRDRE